MYTALKTLQMVQVQNWSLTQQVVVSEEKELMTPKFFNESKYSNITVSLQFSAKKKKATNAAKNSAQAASQSRGGGKDDDDDDEREGGGGPGGKNRRQLAYANAEAREAAFSEGKQAYLGNMTIVKDYLQILGMFEVKNQYIYEPYDAIRVPNSDIYTWKEYNFTNSTFYENGH